MKFKSKVVAAVSATVMTAGMVMSSVPAFAGSEEMDFINSYNGTARELAQYVINEGCTIDEATEIMDIYLKGEAELEEDNSRINTYAEGDTSTEELPSYYNTKKLASTQHYVLVIAVDPSVTRQRLNLIFDGIDSSVLAPDKDSYRTCLSYSSLSSVTTNLTSNMDMWEYTISIPTLNAIDATEAKDVIEFPIYAGKETSNEVSLYRSIEFDYTTKTGMGLFAYETYALGDVNHDGRITEADSTILANAMMGKGSFKQDYKDGSNHYSEVTNMIAADFNKDNKFSLSDLILINSNLE